MRSHSTCPSCSQPTFANVILHLSKLFAIKPPLTPHCLSGLEIEYSDGCPGSTRGETLPFGPYLFDVVIDSHVTMVGIFAHVSVL